ncbi:MAG: NAD-dependent epimerase/dehydratase family protein [Cytophagaceae bacterium]|nr:NAD-dependent epimerase/dehydratase family protein [Cytophagaceae bacterium]
MILLTGATGLVGSFTARRLLEANQKVRALVRPDSDRHLLADVAQQIEWLEGDILDVLSLERAMEGVSQVVHAAAIVSFVPRDRRSMHKINVEGTTNVVNACLQTGVRKLLFVSSVAALGRSSKKIGPEPQIIDENARWEESPLNSNYAKSKYLAELEVWRGASEGLSVVVVNPSLILGAGDWHRSSTQLFKYAYDQHAFYPEGTLNYVDVLDVAEAIYQLLKADVETERFILNAGTISYRDFLAKVAKAFGKKAPRICVSRPTTEVLWRLEALRTWLTGRAPLITRETAQASSHSYVYPNDKIRQMLGLEFRTLDETVARVVNQLKP